MLACRETNSSTLTLLAWAHRSAVFYDTGGSNTPHNARGTGWYYGTTSGKQSWGFAKQGDAIDRANCDYLTSGSNEKRLCWTTGNYIGYRCGATKSSSTSWERLFFHTG